MCSMCRLNAGYDFSPEASLFLRALLRLGGVVQGLCKVAVYPAVSTGSTGQAVFSSSLSHPAITCSSIHSSPPSSHLSSDVDPTKAQNQRLLRLVLARSE